MNDERFPWAAVVYGALGLGALVLVARFVKGRGPGAGGTPAGGLGGVLGDLVGGGSFTEIVHEAPGGSLPVPTLPVGGSALDAISGSIVVPAEGGTVQRGLFADTVRLDVELVNAGPNAWLGPLRLDVHEDYLIHDEHGGFLDTVAVPARSSKRFSIDYRLAATFMLTNPDLYINLFAGTKWLEKRHAVVA